MKRGILFVSLFLISILFISGCDKGDISGDIVKISSISKETSGQPVLNKVLLDDK